MNIHCVQPRPRHGPSFPGAALLLCVLTLAACASVPKAPTEAIQAAELAIANAEKARVADYASTELRGAREDLTAAHTAVQQEKMDLALRLAESSQAAAQLATAKAESAKAQVVNDEMKKSIDTLKQEMQRNEGAR